jgi:nucleoside-diphosphate-sugar epimerase
MKKKYLVTGGSGFIGSGIVKKLLSEGHSVRVFDNNSRGNLRRLESVIDKIEFVEGDIRDLPQVEKACKDIDAVCHLAFVNGTKFFYELPELVLEVGVKGMMNILDACITHHIDDLILASSSEVYQSPDEVPTSENVPLIVPDLQNPRYSYGGGKIISELLAINYGRSKIKRVVIFRPHNVYGPDMGWEHVVPEFVLKMDDLISTSTTQPIDFKIQGTGSETRAFIFIDDFVDGLYRVIEHGHHLNVYHIGTSNEIKLSDLAEQIASLFEVKINLIPGDLAQGGTLRRCPDITKLKGLGFDPQTTLEEGLQASKKWYVENKNLKPSITP